MNYISWQESVESNESNLGPHLNGKNKQYLVLFYTSDLPDPRVTFFLTA